MVDKVFEILLKLLSPRLLDLWQSFRCRTQKLDHPTGSKSVHLACTSREAELANEVYIVGSFNDWLQPQGARINPYSWQRKAYGMGKAIEDGQVHWQKELWLLPGVYDFKFVAGKNQWIAWSRNSGYTRGNDAPGGPNLRVVVNP